MQSIHLERLCTYLNKVTFCKYLDFLYLLFLFFSHSSFVSFFFFLLLLFSLLFLLCFFFLSLKLISGTHKKIILNNLFFSQWYFWKQKRNIFSYVNLNIILDCCKYSGTICDIPKKVFYGSYFFKMLPYNYNRFTIGLTFHWNRYHNIKNIILKLKLWCSLQLL